MMLRSKLFVALAVALVFVSGCFEKKKEDLVVGLSADYPPFSHYSEGKIVGFDAELAEKIAEKMGKKLVLQDMPFHGLIAALEAGKIDLIISGMNPTEERAREVNFSDIYYRTVGAVLYSVDGHQFASKEDLKDKAVGAQSGSVAEIFLKSFDESFGVKVLAIDSCAALVEHLKLGRVDAVVIDLVQAIEFAKSSPEKLKYLEIEVPGSTGCAVAVKKKNTELLDQVNQIIKDFKNDGIIGSLEKKWVLGLAN